MKTFVTGGTGYIGTELIRKLVETDHEVVALYHKQTPEMQSKALTWIQGSLADAESLAKAMQGCQQVYHIAGLARVSHPDKNAFLNINVKGTENILTAAERSGVEKLVFTSTGAVFSASINTPVRESDPLTEPLNDDYSVTKFMAEKKVIEASKNGLNAVIVNPPRVYGPGKSTESNPINKLVQNYLKKSYYFVPGNGRYSGSYVFVNDVLKGHLLAMEKGRSGERYIIGGENHDYISFFNTLEKLTKLKRRRIGIPRWMVDSAASVAELWSAVSGKAPRITHAIIAKLYSNHLLSSEKAIKELGYTITSLEKGLDLTLASFKK